MHRRWIPLIALLLALLSLAASPLPPAAPQAAPQTWPPPLPDTLTLTVRESAGVARTNEVVRSGVPLPRALAISDPATLALVDSRGQPLPVEFTVLARWNAARSDSRAPIQWLLVTFPATVGANQQASYRLVTDGSAGTPPAPATPLTLDRQGNQVTVDTGVATFVLGGSPGTLFDEVRRTGGPLLVNGGGLSLSAEGQTVGHSTLRRIHVEHAGPLSAVVVVEGRYDLPALGGGEIASYRRYLFAAGSPTAIVRQAISWEGDLCPGNGYDLSCGNTINGRLLNRVRDSLALTLGSPRTVQLFSQAGSAPLAGDLDIGQEAWLHQMLRAQRSDPLRFEAQLAGSPIQGGQKADGALLAVSTAEGTVALALDHMHRYEPQALALLADGSLAADLVADRAWLGQRQGLFARLSVSALPPAPSQADLVQQSWAPLNHPLHAWPSPEWFAASEAVDEFPVGTLPAALADYDSLVPQVLARTLSGIDEKGLAGIMTFGLYPRHWGYALYSDELDCGPDEPTPTERWDDAYWCGSWTDYHNTVAAVPIWAMRSGENHWLEELAFPAAWRQLHTQIQQCAPEDDWFYCGQAPSGYGGYRTDFNSSHAYFDNLMLYYWLTGDYSVVEMLQRGAASMRDYLCTRRPAQPCLPTDPPTDEWAGLTGRVASQWVAVFRFVGLASEDPSYLEDWRSGLARALTQFYVEPTAGGTAYGFWLWSGPPVSGPGSHGSEQLWMASLYDMNVLYRYQIESGDTPLGEPPLAPSRVQAAWARTLHRYGAQLVGDGTAGGQWPNSMTVTWSGPRIGGTLESVQADLGGSDPYLYNTGKATLSAVLLRAGQQTGESALLTMGEAMTQLSLDAAQQELSPLGKLQGEYLSRLHAAVARLALPSTPPPTLTPRLYLPLTRR